MRYLKQIHALESLWNRDLKRTGHREIMKINSHQEQVLLTPVSGSNVSVHEQGHSILQRRWVQTTRSLARAITRQRKKEFLGGVVWATMPISEPDSPLQSAHPSLLIKDNAALQGRLLLPCCRRVLHVLLLCRCSLRTNVHVLRTSVGLQQKQNVRGPPLLFSPTPSDCPVQATKHTQARQPLGRHRKEPLLLWFQTSVLINWTVVI